MHVLSPEGLQTRIEASSHPLTRKTLFELMQERGGPHLSLFQSTHRRHPEKAQDPILFKNLVRTLEQALSDPQQYPEAMREALLKPFYDLALDREFWNHTLEGIVVLCRPGSLRIFNVQHALPNLAVVSDSWHLKPLMRVVQTSSRYQLLCLTREAARLYEGDHDILDEIETGPDFPRLLTEALGDQLTERTQSRFGRGGAGGTAIMHGQGAKQDEHDKDLSRYFKRVDRAVQVHYSIPSGLPLILAALPEHQGQFRLMSQNDALLGEGIAADPASLSLQQLRQRAWQVMQPIMRAEVEQWAAEFEQAHARGRGADTPEDALDAALSGRIDKLLIDADLHIPGHLDLEQKRIMRDGPAAVPLAGGKPAETGIELISEDVLDDIAELVLKQSGKVLVIPNQQMPTRSGLAAIYRY